MCTYSRAQSFTVFKYCFIKINKLNFLHNSLLFLFYVFISILFVLLFICTKKQTSTIRIRNLFLKSTPRFKNNCNMHNLSTTMFNPKCYKSYIVVNIQISKYPDAFLVQCLYVVLSALRRNPETLHVSKVAGLCLSTVERNFLSVTYLENCFNSKRGKAKSFLHLKPEQRKMAESIWTRMNKYKHTNNILNIAHCFYLVNASMFYELVFENVKLYRLIKLCSARDKLRFEKGNTKHLLSLPNSEPLRRARRKKQYSYKV